MKRRIFTISILIISFLMLTVQAFAESYTIEKEVFNNTLKTIAFSKIINNTGDKNSDYLEESIASSLATKTASFGKELMIVERNQFNLISKELGLSASGIVTSEMLTKIGTALGATHIVLGEMIKINSNLRLNVRIIEVKSSLVVSAFSENGISENDIFNMIDKLSKEIYLNLTSKPIINTDLGFKNSNNGIWFLNLLIPGLSQVLMSEYLNGVLFFSVFTISLIMIFSDAYHLMPWSQSINTNIFSLTAITTYIWSLIDAYNLAEKNASFIKASNDFESINKSQFLVTQPSFIYYQAKF